MLTAPHAFTGAAIGVAVGNPALAFVGGVVSHFILDRIPHTDPGTWHFDEPFPFKMHAGDMAIGLADLSVTFYGLLLLAGEAPIAAAGPLLGVFGGVLPDIIGLSPLFLPKLATLPIMQRFYDFVHRYHYTARPHQWALGIATQAVVTVGAVWYLLGS